MSNRSWFWQLLWLRLAPRKPSRDAHASTFSTIVIDAEINPDAQSLAATVQVSFIPQDVTSSVSFELNNALNVSRIVDGGGKQVPASRSQQDFKVTLNFPEALPKGQPAQATFTYDGKLSGQEESPVYGIKFASIQKDHAFLMYPARWFPINEYTTDRYTAELTYRTFGISRCRGRSGFGSREQRRKADLYR